MPLLPHADYYYDLTGSNAYVLLNGTSELVRSVVAFLEDNHIRCTGTGVSRYPARSGVQYAWFIRVATETGEKPDFDVVHSLFRKFTPADHPNFQRLKFQTEELQRKLEALRNMQAEAALRLSTRENELEQVRKNNEELAAQQARIVFTAEQWKSRSERLQEEVELLREERARLTKEVQDNREYVDQFSVEFDAQEQALKILQQQYESICAERDDLKDRLSEIAKARDLPEQFQPSSTEKLMRQTFESLMPQVEFLKDSIELVATRLADPQSAMERIRQIVIEKQLGDPVRSATSWYEMHFNTGQDDSGRIYYQRIDGGGYRILVSFKENQEQDFRYFRRI